MLNIQLASTQRGGVSGQPNQDKGKETIGYREESSEVVKVIYFKGLFNDKLGFYYREACV